MPRTTFQEPICSIKYPDWLLQTNAPEIAFKLIWLISNLLSRFLQAAILINVSIIDMWESFSSPFQTDMDFYSPCNLDWELPTQFPISLDYEPEQNGGKYI